jgi:D-alanyl-D-alanine carboxypeptidase
MLAAIIALLAVSVDPSDARSRRKRHHVKRQHATQIYNPPYASIVLDAKSGAVLHQRNPDSLRHPASLTKIMTLYLLFEQIEAGKISLDAHLPVSHRASAQAPTKLGLKPGDTLEVEAAIKALVTKSANDAAVVLAEALGGSEEDFAREMTRKARVLGMHHTVYRNASGLPDDEQVTSARDQALLGIAIQGRFPRYYRYFATERFAYRGRALRNHNGLLGRVDGVDGIKTGYTRASGFNLVSSVRRGGRHIVAVVLGGRSSRQRDAQMRQLIETNIGEATTKGTIMLVADAPPPKPEPTTRYRLAGAANTPLSLAPPPVGDATATISPAQPGSNAPIKPRRVKTMSVKLVPPKAPGKSQPASEEAETSPAPPPNREPSETTSLVGPSEKSAKLVEASIPDRHIVRRGWVIQIGAFEDEDEAKQRLNSAQSKAPGLLENADPYTERTVKGEKTYFRARFAGFNRDRAQAACRRLKRNDIVCMALKI